MRNDKPVVMPFHIADRFVDGVALRRALLLGLVVLFCGFVEMQRPAIVQQADRDALPIWSASDRLVPMFDYGEQELIVRARVDDRGKGAVVSASVQQNAHGFTQFAPVDDVGKILKRPLPGNAPIVSAALVGFFYVVLFLHKKNIVQKNAEQKILLPPSMIFLRRTGNA